MGDKKQFARYRSRIVRESVIKSLFCGISVGSAALCTVAFVTWLVGYRPGLFFALAAFALGCGVSVPLFYFCKFRPTAKQVARRVDRLGLEERMITMTELQGKETFIARAQREDTERAAEKVSHLLLKTALSAALVAVLVTAAVLGAGMTTLSALHYAGIIPAGIRVFTHEYVPATYSVSYGVEENCNGSVIWYTGDWTNKISAEVTRSVQEGESLGPVYAIPAEGWYFVSWSDGVMDPYRHDVDIGGDIIALAIFEEGEEDPEEGEQNNQSQSQQQQDTGEPNESNGNSSSSQQNDDQSPEGDPNDDPSAGGQRDSSSQQVVDGQTYYGDEFEEAYRQAMERLQQDGNIPDDLKKFIEEYYRSIETGPSPDEGEQQQP